jgi:hypothetical protein
VALRFWKKKQHEGRGTADRSQGGRAERKALRRYFTLDAQLSFTAMDPGGAHLFTLARMRESHISKELMLLLGRGATADTTAARDMGGAEVMTNCDTWGTDRNRGLFTTRAFPAGSVLCVYTGEVLKTAVAFALTGKAYLMRLGPQTHINATEAAHGHVLARYINDCRTRNIPC